MRVFLLLFALISLVFALRGSIRYGLPPNILSRAILVIWILAISLFIGVMCWQLWEGPLPEGVRGSQKPLFLRTGG
jgi:hypothetical protein